MHTVKTVSVAGALLLFCLSSCSTTDALTPQVDIPNATTQSTPVTQAEAESLANNDSAGDTQQSFETDRRTDNNRQTGFRPQNTLQAQADALESGNQSGNVQRQETTENRTTALATPETSTGTIRFLPIIGAPVQAVTPLSRQLGAEARSHGLTIKSSSDTSSDHILKGYFSAFADETQTTIVYVWDVLDANGSRLHRIQGQQKVEGTGAEPWAQVPASAMQSIARATIEEYLRWRDARAG